jgi:hypothetical protein
MTKLTSYARYVKDDVTNEPIFGVYDGIVYLDYAKWGRIVPCCNYFVFCNSICNPKLGGIEN